MSSRVAVALIAMLLSACSGARRFDVTGVVLRNDQSGELTVSHDRIADYMEAMVMPFTVRAAEETAGIYPGDRIAFRLNVGKSTSVIDRIRVTSPARRDAGEQRSPAVKSLVAVGMPLPDFTLIDQSGESRSLSALRGQVVVLTFIYTRCPLPDYCPVMMTNFREVAQRLDERMDKDVTLLTITFDPRYDTSEVLSRYARIYGATAPGWYLLTGSPADIQRVTESFGIEFYPEEGLFTHTLQTAVVDREGRLFGTLEGKSYSVRQLVDLVEAAL